MKKRVLFIMCLCILLLAGGCTKKGAAGNLDSSSPKKSDAATDTTDTTDKSDASVTGIPEKEAYKVGDYVTLGNYKGVEVTVQKLEVTDDQVDAAIKKDMEANPIDIKDRDTVKNGDIVNIDYTGLKDGKAFNGGTATKQDLTIGSNSFIPGFETGLIGKKVGEKVDLNLTFPKEYQEKTLAGQAVVFKVTINSIKKIATTTEEYVKGNATYDSVDAYKAAKRKDLETENENTTKSNVSSNVIQTVVKNSKIKSYPQNLIDYFSASYENYLTQVLYYQYGMTIKQFISATKTTQEKFDAEVKKQAESYASVEMVERSIAEAEKMEITDAEYKDGIADYVKNSGAPSEADLLKYMTKDQIKDDMLLKKALKFAVDNAKVNYTTATPTPAPTTAPASATAAPTTAPAAN